MIMLLKYNWRVILICFRNGSKVLIAELYILCYGSVSEKEQEKMQTCMQVIIEQNMSKIVTI